MAPGSTFSSCAAKRSRSASASKAATAIEWHGGAWRQGGFRAAFFAPGGGGSGGLRRVRRPALGEAAQVVPQEGAEAVRPARRLVVAVRDPLQVPGDHGVD